LFTLMDTYGPSGFNLLFIAFFETVVVAWVYGRRHYFPVKFLVFDIGYNTL